MPTYSGLWNQVYGENYSQIDSERIRRALRTAMKNYHMPYNRMISAIVQGVGNAYGDYTRRKSQDVNDPFGTLGGKIGTELKVVINRAPVAQDSLDIRADLYNQKWAPQNPVGAVWPVDKSGNGGGGKAGL